MNSGSIIPNVGSVAAPYSRYFANDVAAVELAWKRRFGLAVQEMKTIQSRKRNLFPLMASAELRIAEIPGSSDGARMEPYLRIVLISQIECQPKLRLFSKGIVFSAPVTQSVRIKLGFAGRYSLGIRLPSHALASRDGRHVS
jgi:hypothetical protein